MSFLSLLAHYRLLRARHHALSQRSDVQAADLSFLKRQIKDCRVRILARTPLTAAEANDKLSCLMQLLTDAGGDAQVSDNIAGLVAVARETCAELGVRTLDRGPLKPVAGGRAAPAEEATPSVFGGSMAEYVSFAEGRVMMVDTDYCVAAVSAASAAQYDLRQVACMGMHLAEVIGEYRFGVRARPRLDRCFDGATQTYHFAQHQAREAQIMRCDMKPVRVADGAIIGALVYVTDVTEQARRLRPSSDRLVLTAARPARRPS